MKCAAVHARTTPAGEVFEEVRCVRHSERMHVGVSSSTADYTWPLSRAQNDIQLILATRLTELSTAHALALAAVRTQRPWWEVLRILERVEGPMATLEETS